MIIFLIAVATLVGYSDSRKEKIRADFSTFSLAASRVMFSGGDPYDKAQVNHNYKYFPANAILLYPFTYVSVYAAQGIWFALNLGLLIWAFVAMRDMLRPTRVPWWVYVIAIAVTFRLIMMNLRLGQWNTSVFCLSLIGLRQILGGRKWGAILLALSITLKFMPCIFLMYLAARRRWTDLGITMAALVFWIFIFPALVLGPNRTVELLKTYHTESTVRVDKMTTGKKVSSLSLHSTVYRALTPSTLEIKDIVYRANLLNLSRRAAATTAKALSIILLLAATAWFVRQGRPRNQINHLGEILLIGICYVVWFLIAPGVRHAQLISTIPLTFALAAAIAIAPTGIFKLIISCAFAIMVVLYTAPAEFVNDTTYNGFLEASGILAWALVFQTIMGITLYYKMGRNTLDPALH